MFSQHILPHAPTFQQLTENVVFEQIVKGRLCANIVTNTNIVPIVRTTTIYANSAKQFQPHHFSLVESIKQVIGNDGTDFNNAMVEIYDNDYKTMRYHTDQAIDLADDSIICLFTCYENPPEKEDIRELLTNNKTTHEKQTFPLLNNSIITFSKQTNSQHVHKIHLDMVKTTNRWLGITFRKSKTFVHFVDEIPYFYGTKEQLTLANQEQRREFIRCKSLENKTTDFDWNTVSFCFTMSPHDLLHG